MDQDFWQSFKTNVKRVALGSDYSKHSLRDIPYNLMNNHNDSFTHTPIIRNMVQKVTQAPFEHFTPLPAQNKRLFLSQMDQMLILNDKLRNIEKKHRDATNFLLPLIKQTNLNSSMSQSEKEKEEKEKLIDRILANKNLFQDELQNPASVLLKQFNEYMNQQWNAASFLQENSKQENAKKENENQENGSKEKAKEEEEKEEAKKEQIKQNYINQLNAQMIQNRKTQFNQYRMKLKLIENAMIEKLNKMEDEQNTTLTKLKHVIMLDKRNRLNFSANNILMNNVRNSQPPIQMSNMGNMGNMDNMGDMGNMGNIGNIGNIGNMGNMGNMNNMSNMNNMGNMGNMSSIGNKSNMGNMSSIGSIGNMAYMNNMSRMNNMGNMMNFQPIRNPNSLRKKTIFNDKKQQFFQEIAQLIDRKLKESKESKEEQEAMKVTSHSQPQLPPVRSAFKQSLPTPLRTIKLKL